MTNKSLISLVEEASQLERALIESNGEITPEIEALLQTTEIHLPEKVDNYAMLMDRMDTVAAFYKAKAEAYLRLAKSAGQVADRCSYNIKTAMQALNTQEILGVDVRFKLTNSNPACVIEDETLLDASYKILETVTKINKKQIAEDLKLGVPVPGARLEQGQSLRRYAVSPVKTKKVTA